jgi:hypothetical protein
MTEPRDDAEDGVEPPLVRRLFASTSTYVLTRFVILRLLGVVYFAAFFSAARQVVPLIGEHGLLPASDYLVHVRAALGSEAFATLPSIFWLTGTSDTALLAVAWLGVALSLLVIAGATNALVMLVLWALQLSLTHVGQLFWGYGWELQLCETGMLAVFLCPLQSIQPFPDSPPSRITIGLFRWLIVRVMLGAGLIKLRGDVCWRDLTCLVYHYETQPNPSPVSWLLHHAPRWFHQAGVVVNHVVELVAPFFAFGPRRPRLVAGSLFVAFQLTLIVSGNLSFLNWLTIVPALACFDDALLMRVLPRRLVAFASASRAREPSPWTTRGAAAFAFVVFVLSFGPIDNLLSSRQRMNASYDPLSLVGTYGAFGAVGKERLEIVLEGTSAESLDDDAVWLAYEMPCKPGDLARRPCVVTPYHYRADWQMWFAAMSRIDREPWLIHLVAKLLQGDRTVAPLFARDPFPARPPRFVRATLYRYSFTSFGESGWWKREEVGPYLRPVSLDDPDLKAALTKLGF